MIDPACGSGGLLLKFAKILGKENVREGFFGQEINLTTYNLARINMFLHNINYNNFSIERGDTLIHPAHWDDEPFDAIVSNPPYGLKWIGKDNPILINDERYAPAGVLAPKSNADLAFVMHMLSWLSPKGTAAIVEFPGVLYRSGVEQKIRKYLVDNNFIDTIIKMPGELFFGTPISTCIIVLKKSKRDSNILFIDASNEKELNPNKMKNGTNKYRLSDKNIDNIVKVIRTRESDANIYANISHEEIVSKNYDLSVDTYLKTDSAKETIDIDKLNQNICVLENSILNKQNRIKELNQQINVEYKDRTMGSDVDLIKLGKVISVAKGKQLNKDLLSDTGEYPVINGGITPSGYWNEYNFDNNHITISQGGASAGYVNFVETKFWAGAHCYVIELKDESVNYRYIYHFLKHNEYFLMNSQVGAGIPSVSSKKIEELMLPLPKREVQDEIASMLDAYCELEAELEARKSQHDFYRGFLFEIDGEENE